MEYRLEVNKLKELVDLPQKLKVFDHNKIELPYGAILDCKESTGELYILSILGSLDGEACYELKRKHNLPHSWKVCDHVTISMNETDVVFELSDKYLSFKFEQKPTEKSESVKSEKKYKYILCNRNNKIIVLKLINDVYCNLAEKTKIEEINGFNIMYRSNKKKDMLKYICSSEIVKRKFYNYLLEKQISWW